MLFPSLTFIFVFLPIVLALYFAAFRKSRQAQNIVLLGSSLFFYAWGEPRFVFVMLLCIASNWFFALRIAAQKPKSRNAKRYVALALVFDISVLFVAKYLTFTSLAIGQMTGIDLPDPGIELPIGISFFTFQAISYVIDVYRGEKAQQSILNVAFYISFFPQLIAGPIIRYDTFASQIEGRKESVRKFATGIQRFTVGLAKKVLLANTLGLIADRAFAEGEGCILLLWLGLIAYTLQIYYDFSGYSDMALGLGKMFGFDFPENFNYPYVSKSISEFWRRWHISLGTWFRDYVYIPLGGSRVSSRLRLLVNLFIVWSLTGLWHGANWTFVVWGLLYFVLLSLEKLWPHFSKMLARFPAVGSVYTLFFVMMGWVLFRADDIGSALTYYNGLFFGEVLYDQTTLVLLQENAVFIFAAILLSTPVLQKIVARFPYKQAVSWIETAGLAILFVVSVSYIVKGFYNPFIYFNF